MQQQTKQDLEKAIYKLSDELDEKKTELYNDHHLTNDPDTKAHLLAMSKLCEEMSIKVYKLIKPL